MPRITALLNTNNDAMRLGRCLETLYPFDEVVVVDHGSRDCTIAIACEYGARIAAAQNELDAGKHGKNLSSLGLEGWVFCLDPREALTEALSASLFEWKLRFSAATPSAPAFSLSLREETSEGWVDNESAQTRLVPASWERWQDRFPANHASAIVLEGKLLRFAFP
jgi:hypothetical protein